MAELTFNTVFQEIKCILKDELFSTMYFGRHCGKNLIILKHHLSVMLAFGDDIQWNNPDFVKSVTIKGEPVKGIQIVGNEDIILMLDESGNLWKLINAFDSPLDRTESLYSLNNKSFYEWVPFKKFKCAKVVAICAMKQGFACIGLDEKWEKKLLVLSAVDLSVKEFIFCEFNSADSFSYYLLYLDIDNQNSILKDKLGSASETLLLTERLTGRTYLCTRDGKNCLIYQSNIYLICALHHVQEECVILCFESGKLVFHFYNKSQKQYFVYLQRKLVVVQRCCCFNFCLLWSDGNDLYHTKFIFRSDKSYVKLCHLKLFFAVQSPLSLLKVHQHILSVTINNIYYLISAGSEPGTLINRSSRDFLCDITETSSSLDELEQNIDMLSHYLYCKDMIENCNIKEKIEIKLEGNSFIIKCSLGINLKHELWKLRLKQEHHKETVHMVEFKFNVHEGMCIRADNPFNSKGQVQVSLIGNFGRIGLFLYLGDIGKPENNVRKNSISKELENILRKKSPAYMKK